MKLVIETTTEINPALNPILTAAPRVTVNSGCPLLIEYTALNKEYLRGVQMALRGAGWTKEADVVASMIAQIDVGPLRFQA